MKATAWAENNTLAKEAPICEKFGKFKSKKQMLQGICLTYTFAEQCSAYVVEESEQRAERSIYQRPKLFKVTRIDSIEHTILSDDTLLNALIAERIGKKSHRSDDHSNSH